MFYLKLLFAQAFQKISAETESNTKNSKVVRLAEKMDSDEFGKIKGASPRNLTKLYEKYIEENQNIDVDTPDLSLINAVSKFLGFKNYERFVIFNQPVEEIKLDFRDFRFTVDEYLYKAFLSLKEDQNLFSHKVGKLLTSLFKELKPYDDFFDFVTYTPDGQEFDFAFIILNFQKETKFEAILPRLEGILKKTKGLQKKPWSLRIITNLILTENQMMAIEQIISPYIEEEVLEYIEFYDIERLVLKTGRELDSELMDVFIDNNEYYKKKVQNIMDSEIYLDDVPFIVSKSEINENQIENQIKQNPSLFMKNEIDTIDSDGIFLNHVQKESKNTSGSRETSWNVIVSEFGFGKTSLLLNLTTTLPSQHDILFIPAAQLNEDAFQSVETFAFEIYRILFDQNFDSNNIIDLLNYRYLKQVLLKKQSVFLFFDGLDEHIASYSLKGLQNIFHCLNSLEVDCIISVRKEFWDDRSGDLESVFRKSHKYNAAIKLVEWSTQMIIKYIDQYQYKYHSKQNENLKKLKKKIEEGKFETLYKDIPKRPLFLNMIVRDSLTGEISNRDLKDLYESYLTEKFTRDREGVFEDNKTGRQLRMEETHDRNEIIYALNNVLKIAASKMIVVEDNKLLMTPHILESELKKIISDLMYPLNIREILLNTVLISFSKRTSKKELKIYFAHKSFQEYYLSEYLKERNDLDSNIKISKTLTAFLN